jgi:hypothetical protein
MSPIMKAQWVACVSLAGLLAVEWMLGVSSSAELKKQLETEIHAEYNAESLPTLKSTKRLVDNYNVIVEKPLFIEGRRPLPDVVEDSPQDADNGQLDDWSLIGIYNKDKNNKRKVALFRKQNEARTFLRLNETQTISGWELAEIQDDRVLLRQGGQQKSIMLRKPRPQMPQTPASNRPARNSIPQRPNVPPVNTSPENDTNES